MIKSTETYTVNAIYLGFLSYYLEMFKEDKSLELP